MKKIIMNLAWLLNLKVTIETSEKREEGWLSTNSLNPFKKFYLHEKPKKIYLKRIILSGEICEIKKISF